MPAWLTVPNALAVVGALYLVLSAVATLAAKFWPSSKAASLLAAAVADIAKLRDLLAGIDPSKAGKVAGVVLFSLVVATSQIACHSLPPNSPIFTAEDELRVLGATLAGAPPAAAALACKVSEDIAHAILDKNAALAKARLAALPAPSASAR